jgi:hypothetical protein
LRTKKEKIVIHLEMATSRWIQEKQNAKTKNLMTRHLDVHTITSPDRLAKQPDLFIYN